MCLVLATDAFQRAVDTGRLRSLLLSGCWVGMAFQTKMVQAWAVVPVFGIVYLLCAPPRLAKRFLHVLLAGAVTLVASLWLMVVVQLTPANDRPYIDGSSGGNNVFSMVFEYNFTSRFSSLGLSSSSGAFGGGGPAGATTGGTTGTTQYGTGELGGAGTGAGTGGSAGAPERAFGGGTGGGPGGGFGDAGGARGGLGGTPGGGAGGAQSGWSKLFGAAFGSQIGWLYPLAALAVVAGLVSRRRRPRTDRVRAGYLMWGGTLLVTGLAFSAGSVPHSQYTAVLAPGLAALSAAGVVLFTRMFRERGGFWWLLIAAIAATVGWATYLSYENVVFLPWLPPLVAVLGAIAIAALLVARFHRGLFRRGLRRLTLVGVVAGVVAMLGTPAAWALSTFDSTYNGTGINAAAGPYSGQFGTAAGGGGASARFGGSASLSSGDEQLLAYLREHQDGATYLMAVMGSQQAENYIADDGASILSIGGFSGADGYPSLSRFQALIAAGELRYVMIGGGGRGGGSGGSGEITGWVTANCAEVPASAYGGTGSSGTLYLCTKG